MSIGPDKSNTQLDPKVFSSILDFLSQQSHQQQQNASSFVMSLNNPSSLLPMNKLNNNNNNSDPNSLLVMALQQDREQQQPQMDLAGSILLQQQQQPMNNHSNHSWMNVAATCHPPTTAIMSPPTQATLSTLNNSDLIQPLYLNSSSLTSHTLPSNSQMSNTPSSIITSLQPSTCNNNNKEEITTNITMIGTNCEEDPATTTPLGMLSTTNLLMSPNDVAIEMLLASVLKGSRFHETNEDCKSTLATIAQDANVGADGTNSLNSNSIDGNNASVQSALLQQMVFASDYKNESQQQQQQTPQRVVISMSHQLNDHPISACVLNTHHHHMSTSTCSALPATCHQPQEYSNCSKSSSTSACSSSFTDGGVGGGDYTPTTTSNSSSSRTFENSELLFLESTSLVQEDFQVSANSQPLFNNNHNHNNLSNKQQPQLVLNSKTSPNRSHSQHMKKSSSSPPQRKSTTKTTIMTPPPPIMGSTCTKMTTNVRESGGGGIKKKKRKTDISNTNAASLLSGRMVSMTTPEEMSRRFQRMSNEEGVKRKRGRPKKETEPYAVRFEKMENPKELVTKKR
ncbi:hypothetical protein FDP41_003014 [Naegleria fowleri]|uniref:Uncharacterized protein n=1 Tax=Naegleria fowleri TaxID=5763 RepID=A0A6A5BSK9_NAEFO|nr:uncharacterized protein FDP41_003014 [Naegleria fowleri]KAF0977692.1 hypothetical protein FDP41_003014 [Naegleria fowleri]